MEKWDLLECRTRNTLDSLTVDHVAQVAPQRNVQSD